MTGFARRMFDAQEWEAAVADWFISRGWDVDAFGQSQLSARMREHLRLAPKDTLLRWLPDFIIAKHGDIYLVDAKASDAARTGNHSVEQASTAAGLIIQAFATIPVVYVFPHDKGEPGFVPVTTWDRESRKWAGSARGTAGSGTPFALGECDRLCSIDLPRMFWDQATDGAAS